MVKPPSVVTLISSNAATWSSHFDGDCVAAFYHTRETRMRKRRDDEPTNFFSPFAAMTFFSPLDEERYQAAREGVGVGNCMRGGGNIIKK